MSPRSIALLIAPLLVFAGCGDEKNPPAPDVDPPSNSGQSGTGPPSDPAPSKPDPAPPTVARVPASAPSAIILLRPDSGDLTLFTQIQQAAKAANLELKEISPEEFNTDPPSESEILIASLPLPMDPKSAGRHPRWILVGTPETRAPLPPHLTHIHPDDYALGLEAGRRIIAALARQSEKRGRASITGNVVQIRASDDDPASMLRHDGFLEILDQHAGVIFVHDGPGFWREADAQKRMEEALRIQKNIRIVFAHSDEMARGARSAIDAFRKTHLGVPEIPILSIGAASSSKASDDPKFAGVLPPDATISLHPLAEKAIEIATRLIADPTFSPPAEILVKPR